MDKDEFWKIIEDTKSGLSDEPIDGDCMKSVLLKMSQQDIASFYVNYMDVFNEIYGYNVYILGCVLNGNALSDDGFKYFRWWLILMGREVIALAKIEPDAIADNVELVKKLASEQIEYEAFYDFIEDANREKYKVSTYDIELPPMPDTKSFGYVSYVDAVQRLPKWEKVLAILRNLEED